MTSFQQLYVLSFFVFCATTATQTPHHNLGPLPPVSICKSGGEYPAFFCSSGNLFTPRGANYIRLWPEDSPSYHRFARLLRSASHQLCTARARWRLIISLFAAHSPRCTMIAPERNLQVISCSFCPSLHGRVSFVCAVAALAGAGYNVLRVFIDHGDGARTDSVGGMSPDDENIILGKECVRVLWRTS